MNTIPFLVAAFVATTTASHAQDNWAAPREDATKLSPIVSSQESIQLGREAYAKTCSNCHGSQGAGDGFAAAMLKRKPKDFSKILGGQSDGEIFWKIRTGNEFMPSFSTVLSEEETWHVVNFIRTLEDSNLQEHPWASFPTGAWVDVHTDHEMVIGEAAAPTVWASDSRMTVEEVTASSVTILHHNPVRKILERASVANPAVDAIPGVRALGQWPHDIFPYGPERESGVTPEDKQPTPQDIETEVLREEKVVFDGESRTAKVIRRKWNTSVGDSSQAHTMTAWVVDGMELPVKWTFTVDGEMLSESELVSLEEAVKVGEVVIPCMVTLTRKHLAEGVIIKRRWSSTQVPGFLVKMESEMKTDDFSLIVNEYVTEFQSSAEAVVEEKKDEGIPSNARPALGFMPEYQSPKDGVLVGPVTSGGPAENGGLQEGDLIIEIEGAEVHGIEDYMDILSMLRIGREIAVKIEREGKQMDLKITIGQR